MELISECNKRMKREQGEYEQQALDLQTRLDDKEFKAEEIAASLRQFKREILTKAENSRTGKGVSQRLIKQFEHAESKKDEDLEKVRLRNISLKTTLRKLEKLLRSREQLAEGLHMIDFEQLKIENQTWNEKIEERNEELAKLKRKKTATVQVLTHVREKIRFIDNANDELRGVLGTTERDIVDSRNRVTFCKHDRDHAKEVNVDLKAQRGFATSDLLIMDFEQRKAIMDNLNATLRDLHDRQFLLTKQINKDTDLLQTMRTVSAGRSGTLRTSAGKKATIGVTAMF
jgi:chromosome segregation ATPase